MTDIFIVTKDTDSSFRIQGVFSNRDEAQAFMTHRNVDCYDDAKIETWKLDSTDHQRRKHMFKVEYIREFDNWKVNGMDITPDECNFEYVYKGQDEEGYLEDYVYITFVDSVSEESALKLGMERIVQFIAREKAQTGVKAGQ